MHSYSILMDIPINDFSVLNSNFSISTVRINQSLFSPMRELWGNRKVCQVNLFVEFYAEHLNGKIHNRIRIIGSLPAKIANIISIGCAQNCLLQWKSPNEIGCMRCETFCP